MYTIGIFASLVTIFIIGPQVLLCKWCNAVNSTGHWLEKEISTGGSSSHSSIRRLKRELSSLERWALLGYSVRVVFNWVSKVIRLLWFMITSISDWFKVLAPFFQPIRIETKTNRGSRVHIFPRFVSATCNYFKFWLVYRIVSVLFDWLK